MRLNIVIALKQSKKCTIQKVAKVCEGSASHAEEPMDSRRSKRKRGTMEEQMKRLIEAMEGVLEILDETYDL